MSVRVTIQDVGDQNSYWNVDLDALPVIGHTLIMATAPKGVYHEVLSVVHDIGGGEQRIELAVRKIP